MSEVTLCIVCGKNERTLKRKLCAECLRKEAHDNYIRHREERLAYAKKRYYSRTERQVLYERARYRSYMRRRRAEDPEFVEKLRKRGREYYYKRREVALARGHEYYQRTADVRRAYGRKYYAEHLEQFAAYRAKYKAKREAERAKRPPRSQRPCSHCHSAPRHRNTSWCAGCLAEYQHKYYLQHRGRGRHGRDQVKMEEAAQAV